MGGFMDSTPSNEHDPSPSLTRREREKLAHRQEIMDAAMRVFSQKGFFNATIDEIAQEAEFSKGALYLYFSSKEDLLFSIIKDKLQPVGDKMKEIFADTSSFREELHTLFNELAETVFNESDFFSFVVSQRSACFTLSRKNAEESMAMHADYDNFILNRIQQAIDAGELRDIDSRAIFGVIHGASENMMFTRWGCETLDELKKGVTAFLDILFEGITRKKEA